MGMTTAVRGRSAAGMPGASGASVRIHRKPTSELVNASAIQEKLATKRTSSAHSNGVVPPTDTTLYISIAP